jgi:3-oxoacyl-[acyl-carrier protein] reductase
VDKSKIETMTFLLKNKVAIVTGSSQGIGAGIAKRLAQQGAKIVINYRSNRFRAEEAVKVITNDGGIAIAVKADISIPIDINKLFDETVEAFGRLDILVNSTGILEFETVEAITLHNLQEQVNVNLIGTILVTQKAVGLMKEGGSIINISATTSINPLPGTLVFSATKAAIDNVTKTLAKELGPKN